MPRVVLLACLALLICAGAAAQEDAGLAEDAGRPDTAQGSASGLPPGVGPIQWAPQTGSDCHVWNRRRICEGPRRVPAAGPEALERQRALELGTRRTTHRATTSAPRPEWVAAIPGEARSDLLWPVEAGRLWRGFGTHRALARSGRRGRLRRLRRTREHLGVDIGAPDGSPIRAVNDGLVLYSDNGMSGYGNALLVVHRDGTVALYGHCRATYVAAGELVRRGQIIAAVGDTGLAHGAHLHFELRVNGRPRDPLPLFVERPDHRSGSTDHHEASEPEQVPPPAQDPTAP